MCTSAATAGAAPSVLSDRLNLSSLYSQTHRVFVLAAARMLLHVAEFPFILISFRLLHRVTTVTPPPHGC